MLDNKMNAIVKFLILFVFLLTSCSLNENKLKGETYYTYYYTSNFKRIGRIPLQQHQVIEMKFSFTADSVTISSNLIMSSWPLKGMERMMREACSSLSYRYTFENQTLNVFGGDMPPSKLTFQDGYVLFEDGSTLYSDGLSNIQPINGKVARIKSITGLNDKDAEEMWGNVIYCKLTE